MYLVLVICSIKCYVPVHVNHQTIQRDAVLLIAPYKFLQYKQCVCTTIIHDTVVVTLIHPGLPFHQCHHKPSIGNRIYQMHIVVEWEFAQQPTNKVYTAV